MARRPLISGNWKMHLNHLEAIKLVQELHWRLDSGVYDRLDVSVHPPFTALRSIQTLIGADRMAFLLGAQHCHWEPEGPYTGEVSAPMLAKLDVELVIAGHSERRQLFGDTDETVNRRVRAIVGAGMTPILCVGETLEERDADRTLEVVETQVRAGIAGLTPEQVASAVIAYEPVWAIGTGRNATGEDAQQVCAHIRRLIAAEVGAGAADAIRIQYGGSVKPHNAAEILAQPDIDGALVGGASLVADDFARIVEAAAG